MSSVQDPVLEELDVIFSEFFMDDSITLDSSTTTDDVAGWDSLTNISLMLAIQQKFAVRFSARDQHALNNVGELAALIRSKRPPQARPQSATQALEPEAETSA